MNNKQVIILNNPPPPPPLFSSFHQIKILEFFVANILIALEYIHKNGILHRDIKPENLVFDSNGYLRLTDFGIARY